MIKTKTGTWTLLAAALLSLAACGKQEDAAPTPVLVPPKAVEKVPAQVEVKASSGPIELAFLLHMSEIKAGEYLWQQIRLKNISDKELIVVDQVFHDPRDLRAASSAGYGIYLEALDPNGRPMKVEYHTGMPASPKDGEVSGLLEVEGPQERAMLEGWRNQGLDQPAINRKLLDFNMKKRSAAETNRRRPFIKLFPGQAAETKSAIFYSLRDEINEKPVPLPVGDFAQIDFFHFDKPGKYKVRAVYDHRPGNFSNDVLIVTPWIPVTVLQ